MSDVPHPSEAAALPGERGISPIAGGLALGRRGKALGVTALAAASGLFLLATARHPQAHAAPAVAPARQVVAFEPATPGPTLDHPGPDAPTLGGGPASAAPPGVEVPAVIPNSAAGSSGGPARSNAAADGPLLAYSRSSGLPGASADAAEVMPAALLQPPATAGVALARATRLPDRRYLIIAGTAIPCVLQTAMDSATPGLVTCQIPSDVYSDDGTVVLLEKGSRVLGDYRGGLKSGQGRLYVVWTRAVTPQGVAIALASPAADALGRAGIGGEVDSHFWQRFGGALLLSTVEGASGALGRAAHGFSVQAPSAATDTALRQSADVAPTLRKTQGGELSILVAQDLDFSGVYGVRRLP